MRSADIGVCKYIQLLIISSSKTFLLIVTSSSRNDGINGRQSNFTNLNFLGSGTMHRNLYNKNNWTHKTQTGINLSMKQRQQFI